MLKDEIKESGKMLALTIALTNFLLLVVVAGAIWLGQLILAENNRLAELSRGFGG